MRSHTDFYRDLLVSSIARKRELKRCYFLLLGKFDDAKAAHAGRRACVDAEIQAEQDAGQSLVMLGGLEAAW